MRKLFLILTVAATLAVARTSSATTIANALTTDNLISGDFDDTLAALQDSWFVGTLLNQDVFPLTFFAPTDDAWAASEFDLSGPLDFFTQLRVEGILLALIGYEAVETADLNGGTVTIPSAFTDLHFTESPQEATATYDVNGVEVTRTDLTSDGGVAHGIAEVPLLRQFIASRIATRAGFSPRALLFDSLGDAGAVIQRVIDIINLFDLIRFFPQEG